MDISLRMAVVLIAVIAITCTTQRASAPTAGPQAEARTRAPQQEAVPPLPQADAPPSALVEGQTTPPELPTRISREEAVQLANRTAPPLLDNLGSLGRYNTVVQVATMTLGELTHRIAHAGSSSRSADLDTKAKPVWAIQINGSLIGTPEEGSRTYAVVGIDAEDGDIELVTTRQSPVLAARRTP